MGEAVELRHDPALGRFVASVGGGADPAVLNYRSLGEGRLEYYRTFTPVPLRGRGIGGRLAIFALDYALEHNYRVVPTCPFVARVIASDSKYAALADS